MRLGAHDLLLITLDTLRFDVAEACWRDGTTPNLRARIPAGWEKRHSPGNFTFSSHAAMLAGFLPTPATPGKHPRRFALRFEGSETIDGETIVLDGAHLPEGFRRLGYRTICIGGVGFFNMRNELGRVLPSMFDEAHWEPKLSVTDPRSAEHQVDLALSILAREERAFLFLNVSALHQPNWFYSKEGPREEGPQDVGHPGEAGSRSRDTIRSHADALRYVDGQLGRLFEGLRRPTFAIVCSDHGTAYGEEGYFGHRLGHEVVWTVPYAEFLVEP